MLTFSTQQEILNNLLKHPQNLLCADCDSKSPIWASLDFGVFLCTNCSGAHRALGPTITRVKSTRLDQWHSDWVENMKLGNQSINKFWEYETVCQKSKPKSNSTLDQIKRYVQQKYLKKQYSYKDNLKFKHPLQAYKNNQYNDQYKLQLNKLKTYKKTQITLEKKQEINSNKNNNLQQNYKKQSSNKKNQNLLDDFFQVNTNNKLQEQNNMIKKQANTAHSIQSQNKNKNQQDDDEDFGAFISANPNINQNQTINKINQNTNKKQNLLSFEELFKQSQSLPNSSQQVHMNSTQFISHQNYQPQNHFNHGHVNLNNLNHNHNNSDNHSHYNYQGHHSFYNNNMPMNHNQYNNHNYNHYNHHNQQYTTSSLPMNWSL